MFKKIAVACVLSVSMLVGSLAVPVVAATTSEQSVYNAITVDKIMSNTNVFDLKAKAAVLMDITSGSILHEKNSHEKLPIASVTKVMSMLLIMEAIDSGKIKYEDKVPISDHSYSMGGSQVYLEPRENLKFTVTEMMKAVAIHSANDGTVALGEMIAGSESAFVAMMNQKAKELGMNDTNFLDCTGLTDDGHYSSAHDVAIMSRELILKHPKILEFTSIKRDKFRDGKFDLDNTNQLIGKYDGITGLKTGFTTKAGHNLAASAKRNNLELVSVVLGEPDTNTRFAETRKLLDYGFANFEVTQINKKGDEVGDIEVKKGLKTSSKAIFAEDVNILLKKGDKGKITREPKFETSLTAPVEAGQKIGEVMFTVDGKAVGKADVVVQNKVEKASFIRLFFRMVLQWFDLGRK